MEKIKPNLHVNGNIIVAGELCAARKMGGDIIPYISNECVDLSKAIVIDGDLHVQSMFICGQLVTCSGDVRCCSSSSSEVDAPCR